MNTAHLKRASFVLDRATAERLDFISQRMGVSRSALVRDVLAEPVAMMAGWLEGLPAEPTEADGAAFVARMAGDLDRLVERGSGQLSLLGETLGHG